MTYSIVIYDPNEEAWGVGVASKFLAVGAFVPWLKPEVGAIATQALANLEYGKKGLELLEKGYDARSTVNSLTSADQLKEKRQLGVVDSKGNAYAFTGRECYPYAGHIIGNNFTVQGNILAGEEVLEAMAKEAEGRGRIYEKILNALKMAESKGGDRRGRQSAAIIVVRKPTKSNTEFEPSNVGKYVDIRVDDSKEPLVELERVLNLWIATFLEEEMVSVYDYLDKINSALSKLGYQDLKSWVEINNFEAKFSGDKIGKTVLKVLFEQAGVRT
ncbi:DUF1028 domain-containing protein [Sulfolobus acidocaldarius]|uniref:Conserved Archaeal protein n=4 Tax=Sulfolobus acidocaldarius TaxID=2285 RepID=Q4J854_SULAC|nr:DUF1028 domain-containing protein [Sulfolobus acidocaldarius]AAY81033.1 conserved Archaeal protein [Sulfolobus acidocaldarius DSM 639]AGE71639.1 hypothetical protein SacN8_08395 [Sulfolobus acidocaldarius N8]AGE73913.1 hypothetical protein SacRon12I_08410 [Sulfolobus acidocaldarius Ron12/I]ALU30146.1 hypothetical protein ATY89_09495 [Sulfolobus acidocaldarius]ALU30840.1 hypothetical protein ATZ20_00905 [Sulfolobus acidocaldarius]